MSQEAAARFRTLIGQDRELQQKIAAALRGEVDFNAIVALGAERGCEFTAEEADAQMQASAGADANGELSDFELELVAGGGNKVDQQLNKARQASYRSGAYQISTRETSNLYGVRR